MKKTFTKLAGGIMAASMILGTAGVAAPQVFADDDTLVNGNVARTITITKNTEDVKDHTYKAYEIFDGVYDNAGGVFKQITWGANIDETKLDAAKLATALGCNANDLKTGDKVDAEKVAEKLGLIKTSVEADGQSAVTKDATDGAVGDAAKALAFAEEIEKAVKETAKVSTKNDDGSYTLNVNTGYWLILDETDGAVSERILKLAKNENENIKPKSSVPESEKHVIDVNDSTGEQTDYQDSADYDIGDKIAYELVASLGDGVQNYTYYWMNFADTICEGLTFDENSISVVVDYDGDKSTTNDQVEVAKKAGTDAGWALTKGTAGAETLKLNNGEDVAATKYEIEIEDLFDVAEKSRITGATTVTVYYTATLNDKAKFNSIGNPNEFVLEYNRNPKNDQKGEPEEDDDKGETTKDRNVVFTYTLDVDKIDGSNQPLEGAKFDLYKKITETDTYKVTVDDNDNTKGTFTYKCGEKWVEKTVNGTTTKTVEDITTTKEVVKGSKVLADLSDEVKTKDTKIDEDAWYVVVATDVDAEPVMDGDKVKSYTFGFKGIDDGDYVLIESTVPAGYNPTDGVEFTVTATHGQDSDGENALKLTALTSSNTAVTADKDKGLETDVVNKKGTELPSTGGIGTTIFYIVGAAAAVTAIVLLTTRRRAHKED